MDRPSFVHNGATKYNGGRSSLSAWFSSPQGSYVLDWELGQFDSAVEDVFGFRAVQMVAPSMKLWTASPTRTSDAAAEPRVLALALYAYMFGLYSDYLRSPELYRMPRDAERLVGHFRADRAAGARWAP